VTPERAWPVGRIERGSTVAAEGTTCDSRIDRERWRASGRWRARAPARWGA